MTSSSTDLGSTCDRRIRAPTFWGGIVGRKRLSKAEWTTLGLDEDIAYEAYVSVRGHSERLGESLDESHRHYVHDSAFPLQPRLHLSAHRVDEGSNEYGQHFGASEAGLLRFAGSSSRGQVLDV